MITRDACSVGDKVEVGYWVRKGDEKDLDRRIGFVTEITETQLFISITDDGGWPTPHLLAEIDECRILRKAVARRDR